MKLIPIRPIAFLLLAAASAFLNGCTTRGAKDSSIPWTQPASWEGEIPGMTPQGN
ncbi:MAG: hypothetical protein ACHQ4G_01015 [Opitutales bacterium]